MIWIIVYKRKEKHQRCIRYSTILMLWTLRVLLTCIAAELYEGRVLFQLSREELAASVWQTDKIASAPEPCLHADLDVMFHRLRRVSLTVHKHRSRPVAVFLSLVCVRIRNKGQINDSYQTFTYVKYGVWNFMRGNKKVRLFPCLIKHRSMETHGGVEVILQGIFTSALDGGQWPTLSQIFIG